MCCAVVLATAFSPPALSQIAAAQVSCSSLAQLPDASFQLTWTQNRLNLCANRAPLAEILREVSRHTALLVENMPPTRIRFTGRFSDLPLTAALQRLLGEQQYIIQGDLTLQHAPPPVLIWVCDADAGACANSTAAVQNLLNSSAATGTRPRHYPSSTPAPDDRQPSYSLQDSGLATSVATEEADFAANSDDSTDQADPKKKLAEFNQALATFDPDALTKWVSDGDPVIQSAAFQAIAFLDRDAALNALLDAMKTDRPDTRLQALQLLDQFKDADQDTVLSALHDAMKDDDSTIRVAAIQALARRGGLEGMRYLQEAFLNDPDPEVRVMVISSVTPDGNGRNLLYQALSDSDSMVRDSAAQLLQQSAPGDVANF